MILDCYSTVSSLAGYEKEEGTRSELSSKWHGIAGLHTEDRQPCTMEEARATCQRDMAVSIHDPRSSPGPA
jgi:hypothetical protein